MTRSLLRYAIIGLIALCLGAAATAGIVGFIPDSGSAPSIFDEFNWSSTSNVFWHVNADGASEQVKKGTITLSGHSIELDRRLQTDPSETVVSARIRGIQLKRFGIGIGVYHAGTIAEEFDDDGIKCGRGTDHGWKVDFLNGGKPPVPGQWYYLRIAVKNPYPDPKVLERLGPIDYKKLKKVTVLCSAWDANGRLIQTVNARDPAPNGHYAALDEAFLRTWDSGNKYQIDWFYAGPPSGDPTRVFSQSPAVIASKNKQKGRP